MFPYILTDYITKILKKAINDGYFIAVDPSFSNTSKGKEYTGDFSETFVPATGNTLIVKGISILGEGNQGEVSLFGIRDGVLTKLLPLYFAQGTRASTSSALNIILDKNTPITVVGTGRGSSKSFVGVSYIEVDL